MLFFFISKKIIIIRKLLNSRVNIRLTENSYLKIGVFTTSENLEFARQ